jgi:beta-glucosidase
LIVVRASGHLFDQQIQYPAWEPPATVLQRWLQESGVGGVILLGGSAAEVGLRSHQLQDWAAVPLLIAADIEEGVGQRFAGATWFPPPMALGAIAQQDLNRAIALAEQMGAAIAQEALAIGINWLLAPVVDVNNNPANPVINVRAFGTQPDQVSHLITAFIRGAQHYPILTTAKHFPGHGDTAIDSHLDLPVLPHTLSRLSEIELPPFKAAIAAQVDAIMTAHLKIPVLDAARPATLSYPILTEQLRHKLGFEGLVVTDALVMGAITDRYGANEAPVLAIEAGADIVLMPVDPEGAIRAICQAVETGRISPERIHASLERIWQAKYNVCSPAIAGDTSHAWETLPPAPIQLNQLAQSETIAIATAILQGSTQVHHPAPSSFDALDQTIPRRNLIVLDDSFNASFLNRQAPAIALPAKWGYSLQLIDRYTPAIQLNQSSDIAQPTLLQLFIRGNPFRNSAGLIQLAQDWLHWLLQTNQLQALLIYGSPYVLEQFLPQLPADLPYGFTYGQMPAAQAIVLETLFQHATTQRTGDREFTD